jgi:chromosome partitioning protein
MTKIITISQQKGGAGKSTIAAHLAVALKQKNNKVALIDIDPQGSTTMWHQVREELFGKGYTGISFSSCFGIRINNEITSMKLLNDYVIIDCPPHTDTESKAAIRAADIVLVPMQPSPTDLWATGKTLEFAKGENKLARIVLNRFSPNMKIAKNLNFPEEYLLKSFIGNRVGFASSMAVGKTILETEPSSTGSSEVKDLVKEILAILK